VGYAGWAAGQLEGELVTGSWVVVPASREVVFMEPERLWARLTQEKLSSIGLGAINPETLPRDPSVN
jgi:putative transcriptional regulator